MRVRFAEHPVASSRSIIQTILHAVWSCHSLSALQMIAHSAVTAWICVACTVLCHLFNAVSFVCRVLRTVQSSPGLALPARSISIHLTTLFVVCQAVRTVQSTTVLCYSFNAALCCLQSFAHSAVSAWTCVARMVLLYPSFNAFCRLPSRAHSAVNTCSLLFIQRRSLPSADFCAQCS